jgi:hypothetical protein
LHVEAVKRACIFLAVCSKRIIQIGFDPVCSMSAYGGRLLLERLIEQ